MAKAPVPLERNGFGLVNPYGQIWSVQIFETSDDALRYLAGFWQGNEKQMRGFKAIPVHAVVSAIEADPAPVDPKEGR